MYQPSGKMMGGGSEGFGGQPLAGTSFISPQVHINAASVHTCVGCLTLLRMGIRLWGSVAWVASSSTTLWVWKG